MGTINRRVVIITGATGVIGSKLALSFGADGWRVVVAYNKNKVKAEELALEIKKNQESDAFACQMDLADIKSLEALIKTVEGRWGAIDVLINNASIARDSVILKMNMEDWNKVLAVNLTGTFNLLRLGAKIMMLKKDGHIINIASQLGIKGAVGASNYAASKAALISLGQSAAKELGRYNIRVNNVLPGFHKSEINKNIDKKTEEAVKDESLISCTTDIRELADFILFLSKTKSITGQLFNCDSRVI